jgi:hypothetical protein
VVQYWDVQLDSIFRLTESEFATVAAVAVTAVYLFEAQGYRIVLS